MIKLICFLSIIAYASSASVKREEYNPDPLLALTNQVNANRDQQSAGSSNNSPVYSPNSYPTYANYANQVLANQVLANSNQNLASNYGNQPDANQAYADNVASASNMPSSQSNQPNYSSNNNNQGNLYYYYYPVQDKSKDVNYQAQPSNQYTSSMQPQNGDDQQNQNNANLANNQQVSANSQMNNNQAHDLSYGAQDLAYTASALNENSNSNGQQGGNYESQLSNLANAFGFGAGSNGNGFGQQFSQLNGLNNMNFGEAFGSSSIQPSSVPFVNDPAFSAAMASQFGSSFAPAAQSAASSGGPLSQLYQQATQMYQGLINGANSGSVQPQFAASQQHASYEPSTGGSGFRSKYGGLGSVVLPLMALAGLSLLIPTVTSLSTVASRKKRSADDLQQPGLDAYLERIDRYYSLYKNAIGREECMNRIICEVGESLSSVRGKDAFFE